MKVAILHYWFLLSGGGEKVVSALLDLYPGADVYCLFAEKSSFPDGLSPDRLHCSFLNRIPYARRLNRELFFLYPSVVGAIDFSGYDLVISSDSAPTKAIVTPVDTLHVSYCHTPGRYIWDLAPSFTAKLPRIARPIFAQMSASARSSDFIAAQRVDYFVANSRYIQNRIWKYYRQDSVVIYPPVQTFAGNISQTHDDYYLTVGRLGSAKRTDLLIKACNHLGRKLIIVGTGREERRLKEIAGPNTEILGRVSDAQLSSLYANCRAFLFAADEDFGIAPVEAQSYGRPVIAYGHGGSLETVRVGNEENPDTGVFFPEQTVESVIDGIQSYEARENCFIPEEIQKHAREFDTSVFRKRFGAFVDSAMARQNAGVLVESSR